MVRYSPTFNSNNGNLTCFSPVSYQLALRIPGRSPVKANWRKQIRQIPK
jgi:hypothetical protein